MKTTSTQDGCEYSTTHSIYLLQLLDCSWYIEGFGNISGREERHEASAFVSRFLIRKSPCPSTGVGVSVETFCVPKISFTIPCCSCLIMSSF